VFSSADNTKEKLGRFDQMSKTFKEGYYNDDNWGIKKVEKTNKQKRQKVNDYLRNIGRRGCKEEEINFSDVNED
jgi:hypothetical protein